MVDQERIWEFVDAMSQKPTAHTTKMQATVAAVDKDGTVWVMLPGSEGETPTESTSAEVAKGDTVTVEWRAGKLYIVGNTSNPSAGVVRVASAESAANQAWTQAYSAQRAADSAQESAQSAAAAASQAVDEAEAASTAASAADSKATAAATAAANAQTSADQAAAAASTADGKATAAATAASNAQTSADNAATAASEANQKATAASTAASQAQTAAGNAQSAAQQATADAATAGRAAAVAQAAADAAQGDIDDMQEWFWHDANGSHVLGDTSGYRNDITSTGMEIVETSSEESVASFGADGAQVGKTSGAHSIIDADGQRFYSSDGTQLANIGYGLATYESTELISPYYTFGTRRQAVNPYDSTRTYQILETCLHDGKQYICVEEISQPEPWNASHWSLLTGAYSVCTGASLVASGFASTAEGVNSTAIGIVSHAEGQSFAMGEYAHAEGYATVAKGDASHAQNYSTIAAKSSQTVIGTYNVEDTEAVTTHTSGENVFGKYALIIGNGWIDAVTGEEVRSNAFTVNWNGNVETAGGVIDGSGNVLADKADSADVYTKTQADALFADKADTTDVYTKTEVDTALADKADTADLADYLPLTGGTLTGLLDQDMPGIERGTPPSSAQFLDRIALCDANGEIIGYLRTPFQADGREGVQLETKRVVSGSTIYHGVQLYIDASGTRTVDLSDKAAWRDGLELGALSLKDSLAAADIPGIPASKITSEHLALARGGTGTDNSTGRAANTVFAAPSSGAGAASWRKLAVADIPTLPGSKITGLGNIVQGSFASQTLTTGQAKSLGTISLAAGTWVITASVWFASNATGRREVKISTTSADIASNYGSMITPAASGIQTALSVSVIQVPTATTTYHLNARQNSGGNLAAVAYMRAVRIE